MRTTGIETAELGRSPLGAHIRFLMDGSHGNMIHSTVPSGMVGLACRFRTIDEYWYILSGQGEVWRRAPDGREDVTRLVAGVCIDIPLGTAFQYRCAGDVPLVFTCTAMPSWPGDDEAVVIDGPWAPVDPDQTDGHLLMRRAIGLAQRAREHGNHPFGALIADAAGAVRLEAENTVVTAADSTGHAELNAIRQASVVLGPDVLATATLYTSTEPCAMCAGAIYWSGLARVVFGLREGELRALTGDNPANPTLALSCRAVFASGQRPIEVIGPLLEEEARAVHAGFW